MGSSSTWASDLEEEEKENRKRFRKSSVPLKMKSTRHITNEADKDDIESPKHYRRFKIQPIYFIMENDIPYPEGNVIKYICRWRFKGGLNDLYKAREYINKLIEKNADYKVEQNN